MDPVAVEAQDRYRQSKPISKEEDRTEFQKRLTLNPYGLFALPLDICMSSLANVKAQRKLLQLQCANAP